MLLLPQQPITSLQGKSNEWYTPAYIIEAARRVMGDIELDPASCELANRTVKAAHYFTKDDNGLAQAWIADSVWCNPPFLKVQNKSGIAMFTNKLVQEYQSGNVKQAVLLATSDCDASWFHQLWQFLICFPDHNVYFDRPSIHDIVEKEARHGHWFGTVFVYLGTNEQAFISEFSKFGHIAKSIAGPRHETAQARLWGVV